MVHILALLLLLALPRLGLAQEAEIEDVVVNSARHVTARESIPASTGASTTTMDREAIERMPQGNAASLTQILLQAPGVVQEAQGDLHVRGDHRNLQYRINGVTLPEAISGFGQMFDARALRSVSLLTGALPAQFGYRTAGIVELTLRSGMTDPGGSMGIYGGSFGLVQPALAYGGAIGAFEYFLTGNYLQSQRGFENPTAARDSINNDTRQLRGIANFGYQLDDFTRLSFIGATNQSRYQVPNAPGQPPQFSAFGQEFYESAALRARQWQRSSFGVVAMQHARDAWDVQVAGFLRQSSLSYLPDLVGEMIFNGAAAETRKQNLSAGLQVDGVWRVAADHTIRMGLYASRDVTQNMSNSTVLPLGAGGVALDQPFTIQERGRIHGQLHGIYAQDEWRVTDRLTFNYGARFDVMRQQVEASQLSPRANLVWRASGATTLSIGYARYFTPPPSELLTAPALARYAGTTLAPEVPIASAPRPERANYLNVAIRHRPAENWQVGADAFYRSVQDMQDLGQFGSAYIFSPYNYRAGRVYGMELTTSYRDGPWLAHANLTLSRSLGRGLVSNQYFWSAAELAQVESKFVRTDHDQLVTGSAGVSWRGWEGGTLSGTLIYGSGMRRGFANSQSVTPYATINLGLAQQINTPEGGVWTARMDVVNLADRSYQLRDGTGIGVGAPQYGMRRGIFMGLSRAL